VGQEHLADRGIENTPENGEREGEKEEFGEVEKEKEKEKGYQFAPEKQISIDRRSYHPPYKHISPDNNTTSARNTTAVNSNNKIALSTLITPAHPITLELAHMDVAYVGERVAVAVVVHREDGEAGEEKEDKDGEEENEDKDEDEEEEDIVQVLMNIFLHPLESDVTAVNPDLRTIARGRAKQRKRFRETP
ncbi:hypothetical protein FB446DRAFT_709949, partial [Lentinula raphanica]